VRALTCSALGVRPDEYDALPLEVCIDGYLLGLEGLRHRTYWAALGGFVGTTAAISGAFGGKLDVLDMLEAWLGGLKMPPREQEDDEVS